MPRGSVAQGIGRLAEGLPLPLLELHTIMHVLCTVAMYGFWWHKPLDVRHPIDLGEKIEAFRQAVCCPAPMRVILASAMAHADSGA